MLDFFIEKRIVYFNIKMVFLMVVCNILIGNFGSIFSDIMSRIGQLKQYFFDVKLIQGLLYYLCYIIIWYNSYFGFYLVIVINYFIFYIMCVKEGLRILIFNVILLFCGYNSNDLRIRMLDI